MKIVLDARMLNWPGVGRYTRNLLEQLQKLDQTNDYVVLLRTNDLATWTPVSQNFKAVVADFAPFSFGEQLGLTRLLRREKPDLVHFMSQNFPVFYRGPFVITIHDLTQLDFQNRRGAGLSTWRSSIRQLVFRGVISRAVAASKHIITDSRYVKAEIVQRYPVDPEKITAVPLAGNTLPTDAGSIERFGLAGNYLLYVGSVYPHKNLGRLVEALALLHKKHPDLQLVLAGQGNADEYFRGQLQQVAQKLGVSSKIVMTGKISDEELAGLYKNAKLFVLPSLSEGFGLPVLEAMAAGAPVACSDNTSLSEVGGAAAAYFDPRQPQSIAETVSRLLQDSGELKKLREAGYAQVKRFSWEKTAAETLAIYKALS